MPNKPRKFVLFFLNGERHEVRDEKVGWMLSDYLRYALSLTGTKIVCAEGDCGACSVLRFLPNQKTNFYEPINSCITTVGQMDGASLLTIEYLGRRGLDGVQKAMIECHGSQCGFCTPGFVMALKGLVDRKRNLSPDQSRLEAKEAKNALTGNLCRCTGYQQIVNAAASISLSDISRLSQEPWHANAIGTLKKERSPLFVETDSFSFFAPRSLSDATKYLGRNKDAKLLAGGSDLGVLVNKGKLKYLKLLSLQNIDELYEVKKVGSRIHVGARATLEAVRQITKKSNPEFSSFLAIFAAPQIKNVATLIGNVANASPIGDTLPFLLAMSAELTLVSAKGKRKLALDDFFVGYRKTALRYGEIIASLSFDISGKDEKIFLYKSSQRKDLDISSVNGAIRFTPNFTRVALGGVAATPLRLHKLEKFLERNIDSVDEAIDLLQKEIQPMTDLRGTSGFRRFLAENFLKDSLTRYRKERTC